MDSIRVSEAPDPGSIPGEATTQTCQNKLFKRSLFFYKKSAQKNLPVIVSLFQFHLGVTWR